MELEATVGVAQVCDRMYHIRYAIVSSKSKLLRYVVNIDKSIVPTFGQSMRFGTIGRDGEAMPAIWPRILLKNLNKITHCRVSNCTRSSAL